MRRVVLGCSAVILAIGLTGCGGGTDEGGDAADPQVGTTQGAPAAPETTSMAQETAPATGGSTSGGSTSSGEIDLYDHEFPVGWQDALDTARSNFDGDVSKIELEREDGRYAYKVELLSDTQKYAQQIDAESGDSLEQKTDDLDGEDVETERQEKSVDLDGVVSLSDAMDAARGAQPGTINKWKLEGKESGAQYEFDIDTQDSSDDDYEVQVDAMSGEVTSTDS